MKKEDTVEKIRDLVAQADNYIRKIRMSYIRETKTSSDDKNKCDEKVPQVNPFDSTILGHGIPNYVLDPTSLKNKEFPPLATPEQLKALEDYCLQEDTKKLNQDGSPFFYGEGITSGYDDSDAWHQTYSGRRLNQLNPNSNAIVIQDIAHHLSMQCRFLGACSEFYSVAQHSVLVSHICDWEDRLWGLLHDGSEFLAGDSPRPLKHSGKMAGYIEIENNIQEAICKRFNLPLKEPASVKRADNIMLATEARDLMSPLHSDWKNAVEPLPFTIEPWSQQKAKDMFMKRFFELTGASDIAYEHYLKHWRSGNPRKLTAINEY